MNLPKEYLRAATVFSRPNKLRIRDPQTSVCYVPEFAVVELMQVSFGLVPAYQMRATNMRLGLDDGGSMRLGPVEGAEDVSKRWRELVGEVVELVERVSE